MTKEDIEILRAGNDLLTNDIARSINQTKTEKDKMLGRKMLKHVISVGEKIDNLKTDKK